MTNKIKKTEQELRQQLTPEQYHVTQEKGTERAFTGKYWDSKEEGTYSCVVCGAELFSSETKYQSGCGWPSFWQPLSEENIEERPDNSFFMKRTEVVCSQCGAHLGHLFDDGPRPTGMRYCINSASLNLQKEADSNENN